MPNLHSHAFQRAIAGRTGSPSPRSRRHVLDVAPGDVRGGRPSRCRRVRGDRCAGVRRDGEGRLRVGRRIPLRPSRSARQAVRRSRRARVAHRRRGGDSGARPDAAARLLRARRISAAPRRAGPAPLRAHASIRSQKLLDARVAQGARGWLHGGRRAAQPARRDARRARARSCAWRRRDAPIHIHAAEQTREVDECYAWSRMRPVEWLLAHARRRRALVHRPRDAHDRARGRGACRERRRRGACAVDRGRSRRRHLPGATPTCRRAAASASAAIRTR